MLFPWPWRLNVWMQEQQAWYTIIFQCFLPNRKLSNSSGFKVRGDVKADNTAKSGVMGENVKESEQTSRQSSSMQVGRAPGVLGGAARTGCVRIYISDFASRLWQVFYALKWIWMYNVISPLLNVSLINDAWKCTSHFYDCSV